MSQTALLVIDVQNALVERAYQAEDLLNNLNDLISRARAAGTLIIYMQHDGDPGELLEPEQSGWDIHSAIQPQPRERVIRKRASDSFYETPLEAELAQAGIRNLVLTGMRTERCVDTTARVAVSKGFQVTLVADAHSTMDGEVLSAEQVIAHTNHNLDTFGNDLAEIMVKQTQAVRF